MARISGSSITGSFRPTTISVSSTMCQVGTIFSVWHGSRYKDPVSPFNIEYLYRGDENILPDNGESLKKYLYECYPEYGNSPDDYRRIITSVVRLAIKCDVPATEFVSYEFCTENASVAWREQLVRDRRLHLWLQTSRTADMTSYDCYRSLNVEAFGGKEAVEIYDNAVNVVRKAYDKLIDLGVPSEDIRLQTQGHIHRCYWGCNLRELLKLISKRSSWIAQASLWAPVIADIIEVLRKDLGDEIIKGFIGECEDIKIEYRQNGDPYVADYKYINECDDRYNGKDPQPVDPLYLAYNDLTMPDFTNKLHYRYLKECYLKIWSDEILEILGWDRNDPNKTGPYDSNM